MRHIKKKFLNSIQLPDGIYEHITQDEPSTHNEELQLIQKSDEYVAHFITDKKELISTFRFEANGNTFFIPEPNPIVIYFSNAQSFLKDILKSRNELIKHLNRINSEDIGYVSNSMYTFFGFASNYITSLFNSLEAFLNYLIPNDFVYRRDLKHKTEIFDKLQIQEGIRFEDKIKFVIPQITQLSFHTKFSHRYETILHFKEFRDEIVHTKTDKKNSAKSYSQLYSTALDFDYIKTIVSVRDFINYYESGLIEECDCGCED